MCLNPEKSTSAEVPEEATRVEEEGTIKIPKHEFKIGQLLELMESRSNGINFKEQQIVLSCLPVPQSHPVGSSVPVLSSTSSCF